MKSRESWINTEIVISPSATSIAASLIVRTTQLAVIHVLDFPVRWLDSIVKRQKARERCQIVSSELVSCVPRCRTR